MTQHACRIHLSVLVTMIAGTALISGCGGASDALEAARTQIAAELPAPYFEDLVTESVAIDGKRLVLLVRSPEGDAVKTREQPQFAALRDSEQREMQQLCDLPAIRPLLETDAVLVRRFVDRQDKVFFEATLPARECANAGAVEAGEIQMP